MNLGEILYRTATVLQRDLRHGVCGPASTSTTIHDPELDEPADFFNGGTFFGLTEELTGVTRVVADWSASAHTLTLADALASDISPVGYPFAVMSAIYPREALVAAVNQALRTLGPFDIKNDALIIAAQTERYALPAGVANITQVQLEVEAGIYSKPYQRWAENNGYLYIDQADYGVFDALAGKHIRLWYTADSSYMKDDIEVINADVAPELLATQAAWHAAMNRTVGGPATDQDGQLDATIAAALKSALERYPIRRRHKSLRMRTV